MRIVKIGPAPEVEKEVICRAGCGATIAYVPNDVQSKLVSCMGDTDTVRFLTCPSCGKQITVR